MEKYTGVRFIAASPLDPNNKREKLLQARYSAVEVFPTAVALRTRVRAIMEEHPELVCVVQNPPSARVGGFLPLGVLAHTVADAMAELSPYRPNYTEADDWTPMVAWFVARDKDALGEISVDHKHPTPAVK